MSTWQHFRQMQVDRGAQTSAEAGGAPIARYNRVELEYRALTDGPALVDRSYRGLLEITGLDRATWLHNLTTNQVTSLSTGSGTYAFSLNVKGRILFDLNLFVREDAIWVDLDRRFLQAAQSHFAKHTIMEDVQVIDRSADFVRLGVVGGRATEALATLGTRAIETLPVLCVSEAMWKGDSISCVRHDFCGPLAVELYVHAARAVDFWNWMVDSVGAVPAGDEAVQIHRNEAGVPWPGHEITDEYLPAETGQLERAVSFNKGCYLGQEVVERMRSRGVVARQLAGLEIEGDELPPAEATLTNAEGTSVGRITSACHSIEKGGVIGLGYVKTTSSASGTRLQASWRGRRVDAAVTQLPFTTCAGVG